MPPVHGGQTNPGPPRDDGSGPDPVLLENRALRVAVSRDGAELASLQRRADGVELLWQGDAAIWPRRAPWLFPVVGRLRGDRYRHRGEEFPLPQHGFARDRRFTLTEHADGAATFRLVEDPGTLAVYPFRFDLRVAYRLADEALHVELAVAAPGPEPLVFSLGAHPGFRCPLLAGEAMSDYRIEFERPETVGRRPVVDGLLGAPVPFLHRQAVLPLAPGLFAGGALVFEGLASERVRLVNPGTGRGVELGFPGFPCFGVWSKPPGAFVCLEPWCGLADELDAGGEIASKPWIVALGPGRRFERRLTLRPLAPA